MKSNFLKIFIVVLAIFLASACARSGAVDVGTDASDFSATDVDGKTVKLSDFKGKIVILNFFATWCPPCRGEIPDFVALQKTYGAKALAIIGVSNENVSTVKNFVNAAGVNYAVLLDASGAASDAYGPIRAIPTTFVIDKEFKIRQVYIGARPREVFENDIKELSKPIAQKGEPAK